MTNPSAPRDALRHLLTQHLGLPGSTVPDALLNEVMTQVPGWANALGSATAFQKDWAKIQVSMPVVKGWVASQDLEILDDWLTHGPPHSRLANVAFEHCLNLGWEAGAKRLWASDRMKHGPALINGWNVQRSGRFSQDWTVPWLETLTWPDAGQGPVHWSSALNQAATSALGNAWKRQDPDRWHDYVRRGVIANNAIGQALLIEVGQAPQDHPWAGTAFQDLMQAKALWSLEAVLWAVRDHREEQLDGFLGARRSGLNELQRVLLLCQVALAQANGGVAHPEDAQRTFDACWRWGLPLSVTIGGEAHESPYTYAFHGSRIGIKLDDHNHRWVADHAPELRNASNTLYLADHWGYNRFAPNASAWNSNQVREQRRMTFAQAMEARVLRETLAADPKVPALPTGPSRVRL